MISRVAFSRYSNASRIWKTWNRGISSTPPRPQEDKKETSLVETLRPTAETYATGVGQVIFLSSPVSGGVILGGLALTDPYLATLAALGTVSASTTAQYAQLDGGALKDGLWGYNGCLVGCAAAVFGPASVLSATTLTLFGAATTPLVAASLKETISIPQWTFAFNIVTLTSLLRTRPLLPATDSGSTEAVVTSAPGMTDLLVSPLTGVSQIFVVESAMSGAVIAYGIGIYSPGLAAHALAGSAIGTVMGGILGADTSELAMGLWGFNSALTSMAVGTFFVHSAPTMALSAGGAAATAAVFGAMKTVFGVYGSPCLTLPFCFTMSACYLLHKQIPSLKIAKSPHSPEKND